MKSPMTGRKMLKIEGGWKDPKTGGFITDKHAKLLEDGVAVEGTQAVDEAHNESDATGICDVVAPEVCDDSDAVEEV